MHCPYTVYAALIIFFLSSLTLCQKGNYNCVSYSKSKFKKRLQEAQIEELCRYQKDSIIPALCTEKLIPKAQADVGPNLCSQAINTDPAVCFNSVSKHLKLSNEKSIEICQIPHSRPVSECLVHAKSIIIKSKMKRDVGKFVDDSIPVCQKARETIFLQQCTQVFVPLYIEKTVSSYVPYVEIIDYCISLSNWYIDHIQPLSDHVYMDNSIQEDMSIEKILTGISTCYMNSYNTTKIAGLGTNNKLESIQRLMLCHQDSNITTSEIQLLSYPAECATHVYTEMTTKSNLKKHLSAPLLSHVIVHTCRGAKNNQPALCLLHSYEAGNIQAFDENKRILLCPKVYDGQVAVEQFVKSAANFDKSPESQNYRILLARATHPAYMPPLECFVKAPDFLSVEEKVKLCIAHMNTLLTQQDSSSSNSNGNINTYDSVDSTIEVTVPSSSIAPSIECMKHLQQTSCQALSPYLQTHTVLSDDHLMEGRQQIIDMCATSNMDNHLTIAQCLKRAMCSGTHHIYSNLELATQICEYTTVVDAPVYYEDSMQRLPPSIVNKTHPEVHNMCKSIQSTEHLKATIDCLNYMSNHNVAMFMKFNQSHIVKLCHQNKVEEIQSSLECYRTGIQAVGSSTAYSAVWNPNTISAVCSQMTANHGQCLGDIVNSMTTIPALNQPLLQEKALTYLCRQYPDQSVFLMNCLWYQSKIGAIKASTYSINHVKSCMDMPLIIASVKVLQLQSKYNQPYATAGNPFTVTLQLYDQYDRVYRKDTVTTRREGEKTEESWIYASLISQNAVLWNHRPNVSDTSGQVQLTMTISQPEKVQIQIHVVTYTNKDDNDSTITRDNNNNNNNNRVREEYLLDTFQLEVREDPDSVYDSRCMFIFRDGYCTESKATSATPTTTATHISTTTSSSGNNSEGGHESDITESEEASSSIDTETKPLSHSFSSFNTLDHYRNYIVSNYLSMASCQPTYTLWNVEIHPISTSPIPTITTTTTTTTATPTTNEMMTSSVESSNLLSSVYEVRYQKGIDMIWTGIDFPQDHMTVREILHLPCTFPDSKLKKSSVKLIRAVKKAYYIQSKLWHPDKWIHQPALYMPVVQSAFQYVTHAYTSLLKELGVEIETESTSSTNTTATL